MNSPPKKVSSDAPEATASGRESGIFIGYLNLPAVLTLSGLVCACLAVVFAVKGSVPLAAICLIYAGIFDLFDGMVARKCNLSEAEKEYGIYIDTVADMVNFGAAPIFVLMNSGMTAPVEIAAMLLFTCCAGTRLAYFNTLATSNTEPMRYFIGLPVTYAALIFPVVMLFAFTPEEGLARVPLLITLVIVAVLFVLRVRIPKPRGVFYIIFPVLALAMTYLWWEHI
jgi:CDP-diacylglycerol--serine O-phosphatidyltransferase